MIRQDFVELDLADAQIEDMQIKRGEVLMHFCDWQEKRWVLRFIEVAATQVLPAFGDLSHGDVTFDDPLLMLIQQLEPDTTAMRCFRLFGALDDEPMVRIVATSFQFVTDVEPLEHTP